MKKKIMLIVSVAVVIVALAATGTALAYNGAADGTGQRFGSVEDYATVEEFHAAVLTDKLAIIDSKLADESITPERAEEIKAYLNACDGTCEFDGENSNRPAEGWRIFGKGTGDGLGYKNGGAGNGGKGIMAGDCNEDGTPLRDGTGNQTARGNRGGRSD